MEPNTQRWWGVTAAAAAAVMCWFLLSMKPDTPPWRAPAMLANEPRIAERTRTAAPEAWPKFGTTEFQQMARERGEKWLEANGRTATNLIAMWEFTFDEALLDEAAAKFPQDPRVCMYMIQQNLFRKQEQVIPWIELLIAAEPGNPHGHYLKALVLSDRNDHRGALAALQEAAAMDRRSNDYRHERFASLRAAALSWGLPEREIALQALWYCRTDSTSYNRRVLAAAAEIVRQEMDDAKALGETDRVLTVAGLGLVAADSIGAFHARTLGDAAAANKLRRIIYGHLPAGVPFGDGGLTAAQLDAFVVERDMLVSTQSMAVYEKENAFLAAAPDKVAIDYANRFLEEGEADAIHWLESCVEAQKIFDALDASAQPSAPGQNPDPSLLIPAEEAK